MAELVKGVNAPWPDMKDARIAELEAALMPFARAHVWMHEAGMGDAMRKQYEASMSCTGKFGGDDLRHAAGLLGM